jgi:hypothetical protein
MLWYQIDYKHVEEWDEFKAEADAVFFSECKFTQNLFNQYVDDSRHQVLSPDLRRWLRSTLLGIREPTWDFVAECYENNGPGADYIDPHKSFSVSHLLPDLTGGP